MAAMVDTPDTMPSRPFLFRAVERLRRVLGKPSDRRRQIADTVAGIGRSHPLSEGQRSMLANLLALEEVNVSDVMVPRADIVAVPDNVSIEELLRIFREAGHSRLPIYRSHLDDVTGMVHVKDLLPFWSNGKNFHISGVRRDVLFVAPSSPVSELLFRMRSTSHMAIVVDEQGGTDGLVTIEDLVEEIVGDIEDEHDRDSSPVLRKMGDGDLHVDARVALNELEKAAGITLQTGHASEVESVGGLVVTTAGRVPVSGEWVSHPSGLRFLVVEADNRRIHRVRVTRSRPDTS